MAKKTYNHNLPAKLALRRHFLRKYHADKPPSVIDCCMGLGVIWSRLRQEFELASYWGIDQKPKKGRQKLDSSRVLAQSGWTQNVIDIDTYGSPWRHWSALLPNVVCPATVFLTIGMVSISGSPVSHEVRKALGLGDLAVPNAMWPRLSQIAVSALLTRCCDYGILLVEAVEAVSAGNARYIGVHLKRERPGCRPAAAIHSEPKKEVHHV